VVREAEATRALPQPALIHPRHPDFYRNKKSPDITSGLSLYVHTLNVLAV
jgi:hypothetical protein